MRSKPNDGWYKLNDTLFVEGKSSSLPGYQLNTVEQMSVLCNHKPAHHSGRYEVQVACPPKIGPPLMRDSCKIRTGGSISENKKVFGDAGISDSTGG